MAVALGAGARFVGRAIDVDAKRLVPVLKAAHGHRGASFVEIFQNCVVYNDDVFADFTERANAPDTQLHVEHGKPLLYGADGNRGIRIRPGTVELETVTVGENGITEADVLVHDQTNRTLASLLGNMHTPDFPVALGVLYDDPVESYDAQVATLGTTSEKSLNELIRAGRTWTVA